jgi:hypothetical protein
MLGQGTSEREWNRIGLCLHWDSAFWTLFLVLVGNCKESRIPRGWLDLRCISEVKARIVNHCLIGERENGLTRLFQHQKRLCCRLFHLQRGWIHHVL